MRNKKRIKTGCLIVFVLGVLWSWSALDIRLVGYRLKSTGVVTGGEAVVRGVAWEELGPIWFVGWYAGGMAFDILIENTGDEELEVVKTFIVMRDPFGREIRSQDFNNTGGHKLIKAGESRPMYAGAIEFVPIGVLPLTWTEVEVQVVVAPVSSRIRNSFQSSAVIITKAGYDEEGYFVIEGKVEAHIVKKYKDLLINPHLIVSYYNEKGEFIGFTTTRLKELIINEDTGNFMPSYDSFSLRLERNRFRNGPIDSYFVHFVEHP